MCYGRLDIGLHDDAGQSIQTTCARPPRISAVISSPAKRAQALATPLAAALGLTVATDDRWAEMDFGAWEGRMWADIDRSESDPWAADPLRLSPPGGESFGAVIERVRAALEDCKPDTAVIAHAGPIRAARMILTGATFETVFAEPVPFAAPITLAQERAA